MAVQAMRVPVRGRERAQAAGGAAGPGVQTAAGAWPWGRGGRFRGRTQPCAPVEPRGEAGRAGRWNLRPLRAQKWWFSCRIPASPGGRHPRIPHTPLPESPSCPPRCPECPQAPSEAAGPAQVLHCWKSLACDRQFLDVFRGCPGPSGRAEPSAVPCHPPPHPWGQGEAPHQLPCPIGLDPRRGEAKLME